MIFILNFDATYFVPQNIEEGDGVLLQQQQKLCYNT